MELRELSEEELSDYLENSLSYEEKATYDAKKDIAGLLKTFDNIIASISDSSDTLKQYFKEDELSDYFIGHEIERMSTLLKRAVKKVYELSLYSGSVKKEARKEIVGEKLVFSTEGEHLHIVFPDLLPRRVSSRNVYTSADIKQMYETPFYDYFSTGKHRIYSKKAVIIYTHVFRSEKEFVDHDNFQTKEVTDLITSWLLLDDGPRNCAILMDYKMGEYSHTEVDVVPFDRLKDFLFGSKAV